MTARCRCCDHSFRAFPPLSTHCRMQERQWVWRRSLRVSPLLLWMMHATAVSSRLDISLVDAFVVGRMSFSTLHQRYSPTLPRFSTPSESDRESMEVIQALVEFHNGQWQGQATSFAVTADVAAGILQRKTSPEYRSSVRLGLSESNEISMMETFEWDDNNKISSRSTSLLQSNLDVDSVDASYSLDMTLPDLPEAITGTEKLLHFGMEHCIAVSDEERVRGFVLYGVDQSLARLVVCHERKVQNNNNVEERTTTQEDLLALDSDVDRIVDKITGQLQSGSTSEKQSSEDDSDNRWTRLQSAMSSSESAEGNNLVRHPISLLEIASGVWLGDSIIRDISSVEAAPFNTGSGFGGSKRQSKPENDLDNKMQFLARWDIGVQKTAWRWIWDFGDSIRQQDDVGTAMGAEMAEELWKSLSGSVCVNESLSRRIPKDSRMVYVDWNNGDYVGFIVGSVLIQVPRFITFNRAATKKVKSFFTEFCIFQSSIAKENELPELCCSKMARVYNFEGKFKQGCTSFYSLNRFAIEEEAL